MRFRYTACNDWSPDRSIDAGKERSAAKLSASEEVNEPEIRIIYDVNADYRERFADTLSAWTSCPRHPWDPLAGRTFITLMMM